jgi:putative transposase
VIGLSRQLQVPITLTCRTLGVARRWFYYRRLPRRPRPLRRPQWTAALQQVLALCPPSYGDRRIHARLVRQGLRCNRKTVYQHLKRQAWLASPRHRTVRPGRRHEGKVAVLRSNQRGACDITTLKLWNGQKLRRAVMLDCADRLVLAWKLQPRLTTGEVGELLREALFARFGQQRQHAKGLEFLTDKGPEFVAQPLQQLLNQLGLVACRTPCRSPQSIGLVESCFGSFKRDSLSHQPLETLAEARKNVPAWIAHYNESAPHSALALLSPTTFYQLSLTESHTKTTTTPVQF